MAQIYVRRIRKGQMTLVDVPDKWKEQVRRILEEGDI